MLTSLNLLITKATKDRQREDFLDQKKNNFFKRWDENFTYCTFPQLNQFPENPNVIWASNRFGSFLRVWEL